MEENTNTPSSDTNAAQDMSTQTEFDNKENTMRYEDMTIDDLTEELHVWVEAGGEIVNQHFCYDNEQEYNTAISEVDEAIHMIQEIIEQKENTMKNAPFHNCHAITQKGTACQSNVGKFHKFVLVNGGKAVHEDVVNANNMVGWYRIELPFCKTHVDQLLKGKTIAIQSIKRDIVEETKALAPKVEKEVKKMEKKGISCGKCHGYHPTAQDVRSCYKGYKKVVTPVVKEGVKCGHCKEYHPTAADVKACYGR